LKYLTDVTDLKVGDYVLVYNKDAERRVYELYIGVIGRLFEDGSNFADMKQLYSNRVGWEKDYMSIYRTDDVYVFDQDDINWLVMEIV
jgi:hypothetical protein